MSLDKHADISESNEEPSLNGNYEMKVFEILENRVPQSVCNKYSDICEIFDEFLERGLYAYYEETFSDTHASLTGWILESENSPEEVLDLIKHVFQIVVEKEEDVGSEDILRSFVHRLITPNNSDTKLNIENKHLRSWLVLATLMSLSQIPNLTIDGTWEDVIYELLKYIRTWDIHSEFSVYSLTSRTVKTLRDDFCWEWMIEVACSSALCPNPYLRHEFFRLILMFDPEKIVFSNGKKIITGYVECISSINPEQLFINMGNNLLCMRHLMASIFTLALPWRLKHLISGKVVKDLHQNRNGMEVRFVGNSLKIIGMFAQIAKTQYKSQTRFLRHCLNICMYLFMFGHNNNFSENIYNHKLLLPYTYCALADITDGILSLSSSIMDENGIVDIGDEEEFNRIKMKRISLYNKIVKRRNDLVNDLELPNECFFHVKLCQREQSGNNLQNILLLKKAALVFTKLELGTICSDEIAPMSYYHDEKDDDSQSDSEDGSGSSFSDPFVESDSPHTENSSSDFEENSDGENSSHISGNLNSEDEEEEAGSSQGSTSDNHEDVACRPA